jgi:hypothetical protein
VEQTPSRIEEAIDFFPAAGFQVVPHDFDDVQLPKGQSIDEADWQLISYLFAMRFSLGHGGLMSRGMPNYTKQVEHFFSLPYV